MNPTAADELTANQSSLLNADEEGKPGSISATHQPALPLFRYTISNPRIVPVAEAKRSPSIPIRCSIETKRLGRG